MAYQEGQPKILELSAYPVRRDVASGVSSLLMEQKEALAAKGWSVDIVGPATKDPDNIADYKLGNVVTIAHNKTVIKSAFSLNLAQASRIISLSRPDFLIIEEPAASPPVASTIIGAALMSGLYLEEPPIRVVRYHGQSEHDGRFAKNFLWVCKLLGVYYFMRHFAQGRIAVSHATARYWAKKEKKDPENYQVIHNGISTKEFNPERFPATRRSHDAKTRRRVLFYGRHDERKGLQFLIPAFGQLKQLEEFEDLELMIAGQGRETPKLQRLVQQLQLPKVTFLGTLPRERLIPEIIEADLVVAPAIGWEGFGRVIIEAASLKKLVVATDINGYREACGGQPFAHLVKPADIDSLAAGISFMLKLPDQERAKRAVGGRSYAVSSFDWEVIAEQTINYLESLRARSLVVPQSRNQKTY